MTTDEVSPERNRGLERYSTGQYFQAIVDAPCCTPGFIHLSRSLPISTVGSRSMACLVVAPGFYPHGHVWTGLVSLPAFRRSQIRHPQQIRVGYLRSVYSSAIWTASAGLWSGGAISYSSIVLQSHLIASSSNLTEQITPSSSTLALTIPQRAPWFVFRHLYP